MTKFNLENWCKTAEDLNAAYNEEEYKMKAGLSYSETFMMEVTNKIKNHNIEFLNNFDKPRTLYNNSIASVAGAESLGSLLQMNKTRSEKIRSNKFKIGNENLTWNNLSEFFSKGSAVNDSNVRKEIIDHFINLTDNISPFILDFFKTAKFSYEKYDMDVLTHYLELENVKLSKLKKTLHNTGKKTRKILSDRLKDIEDVIKKPVEYYDTTSFLRTVLLGKFNKYFSHINGIKIFSKTIEKLGMSTKSVKIDYEYRKEKIPVAWCYPIRIPNDVRISIQKMYPLRDFQLIFHELGHGVHFSSINNNLPYWKKYIIANGISEMFSSLFEELSKNKLFLEEFISKKTAEDLSNQEKFFSLFYISTYCAFSLTKLTFWEKNLNFEEIGKIYSKYMKDFVGIDFPENHWKLHHIMPDFLIYEPSYFLASIRAAELENFLIKNFDEKWWKDKKSGNFLKKLMNSGADIDLSFSKLDSKPFIDNLE